jgi:hypothetical protein
MGCLNRLSSCDRILWIVGVCHSLGVCTPDLETEASNVEDG